jgi:hypothetical protein
MPDFTRETSAGSTAIGVTFGVVSFFSLASRAAAVWGDYVGRLLTGGLEGAPAPFISAVQSVAFVLVNVAVLSFLVVFGAAASTLLSGAARRILGR